VTSEVLVIALSTGALQLVMRREFSGEGGGTL
jgi:hypothetical protein